MDNAWWMMNYLSLWVNLYHFVVHFIYGLLHAVTLQIATLARSTLSTMAYAVMLVRLHQYKIRMFLCCVVLHKLSMCNFDSCKSLTCYTVCIN